MSTQRLSARYHCTQDCRFEGCPGHQLDVTWHHTSDTISIDKDYGRAGATHTLYERGEVEAMRLLFERLEIPANAELLA